MKNKTEIKNTIELWLENLGYSFNSKLYGQVVKMSHSTPSYKVMADITLKNIKRHSPTIESPWEYTRKFVNGMKSNMIKNNKYFQTVFKNGLYNPLNNRQDKHVNLFDVQNYKNNEFNFLKDVLISSNEYKKMFDFIILINGFPLLLIEIINKETSDSFEKGFDRIEDTFDNLPMFFNFNRLILLTDSNKYKLGTLYDFPEDYIKFFDETDNKMVNSFYDKEILEKILAPNNILGVLKNNREAQEINDYIKENLKHTNHFKDMEELSFLSSIFNSDLDEIINSEEFEKKLEHAQEVPDYRHNKDYIEDIQNNANLNTMETFVKANKKLVIKEANRFLGYQTTSMDFDDMCQLGYMGLLKALEKFDLEKANEFSTYAVFWIRQSIIRGINDESLLIRVPVHRWDSIGKLGALELKSHINFGEVDYNWISKEMEESSENIKNLLNIRNTYMKRVSLDTAIGENRDSTLGEFIVDEKHDVEKTVLDAQLKTEIHEILKTLDERSKNIIIKRFGLDGQDPLTLEEIGSVYNLTRERIRQIESKSLSKLERHSRSKELKSYLEG